MAELHPIQVTVNGQAHRCSIAPRTHLVDFLREDLGLKGSHLGCEHGVCGACTVELNGQIVRGCLTLAVQADGAEIRTVEGLALAPDRLSALQEAFRAHHGLQCGFCTPGILMSLDALLRERPDCGEAEIREMLSGHLCRCTGYTPIVKAALAAAEALRMSHHA